MEKYQELAIRNSIVAVVDDDAAVRNSLKFSLEIEGYVVHVYSDGAELLSAGDLSQCACFVVDQNLPGMAGLDVVARLRDRRVSVPAILITSHPTAALSKRATNAGIAIVEKPLLGNALIDSIHAAVGNQFYARQS